MSTSQNRTPLVLGSEAEIARFRLFEIGFTVSFLVYMSRNLLAAGEWLTARGFHWSAHVSRSSLFGSFPLLPGWAVPCFAAAIYVSGLVILICPRFRRIGFGVLCLCAIYAEGVDPASAFALNQIYIGGFLFLTFSPEYDRNSFLGSQIGIRCFQAMLVTMYFATGVTKWNGDWWTHSDVVWTHAQGYYRTGFAATLLRKLPMPVWSAIQYTTLFFELGAPLWFGWKWTRPAAIVFGLSFHLGIALMMKAVWVFSFQMMAFYALFLPEPWVQGGFRRVRQAWGSFAS